MEIIMTEPNIIIVNMPHECKQLYIVEVLQILSALDVQ